MAFVYSTMSSDVAYIHYAKGPVNGIPVEDRRVTIKGGANVADKRLVTPFGVGTEVSDDDLAFLAQHKTFLLHKKNGFITIHRSKTDDEVVAADMAQRDRSAPLRPEDFEKSPKTGAAG